MHGGLGKGPRRPRGGRHFQLTSHSRWNAPELPITGAPGYSDILRQKASWRILNMISPDGRYRVQVAQSIDVRDQAALEAYLAAKKLNPLESEFDFIYINGSHALPSDGSASTRVRLIEEAFAQRMWEDV